MDNCYSGREGRAEPGDVEIAPLTEAAASAEEPPDKDPESELDSFRRQWRKELRTGNQNDGSSSSPDGYLSKSMNKNETCNTSSKNRNVEVGNIFHSRRKLPVVHESPTESIENDANNANDNNGNESPSNDNQKRRDELDEEQKEHKARLLYIRGVELERAGDLYEAIRQYRRAMQLVPDIESRHWPGDGGDSDVSDDEGAEDNNAADPYLLTRLKHIVSPTAPVCQQQWPQQAAHISSLPRELLEQVLLWVVGGDLDMRSLHGFAATCRGLYIMVTHRQQALWRRACYRVWGRDCHLAADPGHLSSPYTSWRQMFLTRAQPRYNGCYIAKTSYFRSGECNFHDQNYQPWHLVCYYRLIRLFAGGTALMLTTSDRPQTVVQHLAYVDTKHTQVLTGDYKLDGAMVHLAFSRLHMNKKPQQHGRPKGRRREHGTTDVVKTDFCMTLELVPSRRGDCNWFLSWRDYSITCESVQGTNRTSHIDVSQQENFPQLAFSRVKSYTRDSTQPLQ